MRTISVILFTLLINFSISAQNQAEGGLKVGDIAPNFSGIDQNGKKVALEELLKSGKVVLIFYRGEWCPYCNKYMSELQDGLATINAKGARVVAITPETLESSTKTIQKTKAQFSVFQDTDRSIMKSYKVLYRMEDKLVEKYKGYGIDLEKSNGAKDQALPVPATYIIGKDGKITFVHYEEDYKKRASLKDILSNL